MKQNKSQNNIPAIAIMFFLFMMISFVTGLQNPFGVIVKNQFNASDFMSQLGNAANFIAYAFMGLPAGFILTKYGYKKTALLAVTVGFIGVGITFLSGRCSSFTVYLIGAFVSGFSMCILNTVINPLLNTLGGGGKKGNQLIQFGGSLNSLAATICPVFVGYLIGNNLKNSTIANANPALFIAMAIFALAFFIIYVSPIPEPNMKSEVEENDTPTLEDSSLLSNIKGALSYPHYVFGVIAIFLYVGIEVGIPNFANLYMTSDAIKIDPTTAGSVIGIYWFLMLVGRIIGGVFGGKISSKGMTIFVSSLAIILLIGGIATGNSTHVLFPALKSNLTVSLTQIPIGIVFFMLCGLCTSVMWGAIFNLAVEGLNKYTTIASGLFMVMVCGGGILPLVQGFVSDHFGYINSYYVILFAVIYILWFAIMGSQVGVKSEE